MPNAKPTKSSKSSTQQQSKPNRKQKPQSSKSGQTAKPGSLTALNSARSVKRPSATRQHPSAPSPKSAPTMNLPTSTPSNAGPAETETAADQAESQTENLTEQGFLPVLQNKKFLTLWAGQVFSQIADKIYLVLMIALIDGRFQQDNQVISGWVSSIMVAFTIPAVLFGSVAGVYVDRWSKKSVLVLTNLMRGALVFAMLPLLGFVHNWQPWGDTPVGFALMLGITFLVSTLTQFFAPAEQSVIPLVVEKRDLLPANSLYTTTMMISVILGFALGEPLLALADNLLAGFHIADLGKDVLVGGGYAIAGLILVLLKTGEKPVDKTQVQPHVLADIKDGVKYLSEQPRVRAALIQLVILFSIFAALSVLAVRLAEVMPELKSSQFGFLLAAGGVGMAIGAAVLGNFGQRLSNQRLGTYGSIGMATGLGILAMFHLNLWVTLSSIALIGACAALVGIPMQTTIQQETPEAMRGKVFGLQNNAVNIALSLPLVLAGVAESMLGLKLVFFILAGLVLAGGALSWYISRNTGVSNAS
ncbi:MFS transporter [Romeriopsis navalis]|nr:MFS transporter [Romeriopsis navalis]